MYDAVCSACGAETKVPFKPTEGKEVFCKEIHDNYQRLNRIPLGNVICDTIKVTVHRAYGIHFARIFEIRTY